jgi:tetratricopeptide (TPR) repeat protein
MRTLLALTTAVCFVAGPTWAAVTIIGGGQAQACYQAAKAGKSDKDSENACNSALDSEMMMPSDRGGTFINRGVMRLRRGEYEAAHADFDAGIALIPDVGEGFINRGAMYLGEKRYKEALVDLDKALSLGLHEPAKAYFDRAIAYEGLDDEKSAYLDYQEALVLQPGWEAPQHELLRFTVTRQ